MVPFRMTLNKPNPLFEVTTLFDAKYLPNGYIYNYMAIVTIEGE